MGYRSVAKGNISFGLVNIPIKFYTAASSEAVKFNLLHPEKNVKLKQQLIDPTTGDTVERKDAVKGYEHAKDQFVKFTQDELKQLDGENTGCVKIDEFIPLNELDFVQIEKSYYICPDKGAANAFQLLTTVLSDQKIVAIGKWTSRGKDNLVAIRSYKDGMVVHQLYYANEVRAYESGCAGVDISDEQKELATELVERMTNNKFNSAKYRDEYAVRVTEAVEQKIAGKEVSVIPSIPQATVVDMIDALKKSLADKPAENKKKTSKKKTTRKKKTG